MNSDINLIKQEVGNASAKRLKILRATSVAVALVVAVSSIVLFAATRQNSLEGVKAEQNSILQNITLLGEKAAKLNFLNDRVRNIEGIINERKNYISTVGLVLDGMPSNVSTSSLTLDKENILLTVSSNSLSGINEFLNNTIEFTEGKHLLGDLTIESLSAQGGLYSLTLKAKLL